MRAEWDESFFEGQREEAAVYWVCFWTGDDVERAAQHDPQRITGAGSVEEVLAWVHETKGERGFELFVETAGSPVTGDRGAAADRDLLRLAGDFRPGGTTYMVGLYREG